MARMIRKSLYQQWPRQNILPQIYQGQWRELKFVRPEAKGLKRDTLLKVISWNIDFGAPSPKVHVAALMDHLRGTFKNDLSELVVLLQEVSQASAQQIMQMQWVQENFILVGREAPRTFKAGIPRQARYYTMAMTQRSLRLLNSFRLLLPSEMGRDALFLDLGLRTSNERPKSTMREVLRICTTNLESFPEGKSLRAKQLELISKNLEGAEKDLRVVAGIVGGDMNAIHDLDRTLHKQLGLKDAWENQLTRNCEGDSSFGQANAHTWGYQSKSAKFAPARLDKFLYRGCVEITTLTNTRGAEETVGRLGVGLTADVSSKEQSREQHIIRSEDGIQKIWASDHYGIIMTVKIVA